MASKSKDREKGNNNNRGWCKASCYRNRTGGKVESEAIPRCWVSRSPGIIKWPPSYINFKSAIEYCLAPPLAPSEKNAKWTSYTLISCTISINTLAEAQQLQTDLSDPELDDRATEEVTDERGENGMPRAFGQGHRVRIQKSQLVLL